MSRTVFFICLFSVVFLLPYKALSGGPGPTATSDRLVTLEVPPEYKKGPFRTGRTLAAPPGFRVGVFASGLGGARFMAFTPEGTLLVSVPERGRVLALPDKDSDGVADSVKDFAWGLNRPHGLAYSGSDLVVAENSRLIVLRDKDADLKADVKGVISESLPAGGGHWTRTVVEGPGGDLFVSAGSSCNVCIEKNDRRAAVMRFPPEGGGGEIFATGLRNTVGLAVHPDTGELWGVDNGRDLLGDDLPPEELNLIEEGGDYGWPYCYGDRVPDPEYGTPERCSGTRAPAVKMQAHSAPLGLAFSKGVVGFPTAWRNVLFVAFHGSWNRSVPTGYKVVAIPFREGRPSGGPVDFITGWLDGEDYWGRPVDLVVGPDGALYLSDDFAGTVYRITHE